tara:strand:+ start:348 stop:983 length:636 start_codon:yes stop_codon:yes gene_type:complete
MRASYKHGEWVVSATATLIIRSRNVPQQATFTQSAARQFVSFENQIKDLSEIAGSCQRRELWRMLSDIGESVSWSEIKNFNGTQLGRLYWFVKSHKVVDVVKAIGCAGPVFPGTASLRPMFIGGRWANHVRIIWRQDGDEDMDDAFMRIFGFIINPADTVEIYASCPCCFELHVFGIVTGWDLRGNFIGIVDFDVDSASGVVTIHDNEGEG